MVKLLRLVPGSEGGSRPRPCENARTIGGSLYQSIFGRFPPLQAREAKKFAPDAPFSDNFRVFTQPGPFPVLGLRSRGRRPMVSAVPTACLEDLFTAQAPSHFHRSGYGNDANMGWLPLRSSGSG